MLKGCSRWLRFDGRCRKQGVGEEGVNAGATTTSFTAQEKEVGDECRVREGATRLDVGQVSGRRVSVVNLSEVWLVLP